MQSLVLAAAWTARALTGVRRDPLGGRGMIMVLSVDLCAAAVGRHFSAGGPTAPG